MLDLFQETRLIILKKQTNQKKKTQAKAISFLIL